MRKILILGGNGFLGKNLNFELQDDYTIINESRRTGCDMMNYEQLCQKIKTTDPDIIINAAAHVGSMPYVAKYAADVCHDNTLMYINLFQAVKEINPEIIIINPISNCSYPGIIDIQHEEMWWDGIIHKSVESYGNPKKIGYILSNCYRDQYGIQTINLIIPNAYGPNDYIDEQRTHAMNGLIMRMIKAKRNKDAEFVVWGSGTPIREWIYMPDVARLIHIIIKNEKYNLPNPINLGQETGITILDSVKKIKLALKYNVNVVCDTSKPDGAPIKILGNKQFKQQFPYFKFTNYTEGITNTIQYYENTL